MILCLDFIFLLSVVVSAALPNRMACEARTRGWGPRLRARVPGQRRCSCGVGVTARLLGVRSAGERQTLEVLPHKGGGGGGGCLSLKSFAFLDPLPWLHASTFICFL